MDTNKVNYEQKRWNNKEMLLNINMQSKCLKRVLFLATRACGFNTFIYFELFVIDTFAGGLLQPQLLVLMHWHGYINMLEIYSFKKCDSEQVHQKPEEDSQNRLISPLSKGDRHPPIF
jgi:hypothetical protein